MFVLKACPRCHGDILVNSDGDPTCLQCGYDPPLSEKSTLRQLRIPDVYFAAWKNRIRKPDSRVPLTSK